jgi:CHASE3 domain sensor protein
MAQFRDDVQSFINECEDDASMEDIQEFFDTPENIANGFLDSLGSKEIKKAINWKKVLLIGLGLVLLALALWIVISLIDGHLAATGYGGIEVIDNGTLN